MKPCTAASSSSQSDSIPQWHQWSSGAGLGALVDQQDLPGPQGTKQLHLRKKEGPDEEELETVGQAFLALLCFLARVACCWLCVLMCYAMG